MTEIKRENFNAIDLAKFICALIIVTIHCLNWPRFEDWATSPISQEITRHIARIPVPFFFVASGFFLFRKMPTGKIDTAKIKKYFLRILQLWFLWNVFYLAFVNVIPAGDGFLKDVLAPMKFENISWYKFIMSGSFFQIWFLQSLLIALFWLTMFVKLKFSFRTIFFIAGFFYIFAMLGTSYYGILMHFFPPGTEGFDNIMKLREILQTTRDGLCFGLLYLSIGAYIAWKNPQFGRRTLIFSAAATSFIFWLETQFLGKYDLPYHNFYDGSAFIAPTVFFIFLLIKNISLPDSPAWKHFRDLSMMIYYVHPIFMIIFAAIAVVFPHSAELAATLILSWLLSEIILKATKKI